ncbi:NAD(P)-dependent oxidoreductase [Streptomyces sp. JHA26]|uniref:NAD-dependent epimerase/dehydratase family protein n=1 Tax=Streptomyces sp. JHA26 TaxID=1917143 RepID=UPI0015C579E4|nr:NAD-dependent epimerase/dehydratase family protein [Streptomyces sp. JHA26]
MSAPRSPAPHVALTGATGYTGRAFLRRVAALPQSWRVTALVRSPLAQPPPFVRQVVGELPDELPEAFPPRDATVLVHLASEHRETDRARLQAVNVDGTRAVLDRLPPSVRSAVHGSSMSVYGQGAQEYVAESAPPAPATPLARTRLAAERLVLEAMRRRDGGAYMLRPRFLPGAEDPSFLALATALRAMPLRLAPDQVRLSVMDVDDYAEAIVRLVARAHNSALGGTAVRRVLNVAYRKPLTLRELFDIAPPPARAPVRLLPPQTVIRAAALLPGHRARRLATFLELATRSHWADVRALEHEIGSDLTAKSPAAVLRARRGEANER